MNNKPQRSGFMLVIYIFQWVFAWLGVILTIGVFGNGGFINFIVSVIVFLSALIIAPIFEMIPPLKKYSVISLIPRAIISFILVVVAVSISPNSDNTSDTETTPKTAIATTYANEAIEKSTTTNTQAKETTTTESKTTTKQTEIVEESTTINGTEENIDKYYLIDKFIEKYNEIATVQILNDNEIDIQDKSSGHYRTEYRLYAFKNAVAKQCEINGELFDIVNYGSLSNDQIRLYFYTDSIDSAEIFLNTSVRVLYEDYTDEDISKIDDELRKRDNGNHYNYITYYYNPFYKLLFVDFDKLDPFINIVEP